MIKPNICYKINTAMPFNIEDHLNACKDSFSPPLNETINIEAYSLKIHKFAVRFEAWHNNQLVGLIAAYFNNEIDKMAFITNVSVLKSYSGIGIASALLEMCIGYARKSNIRKIGLEVNETNKAAIHLYSKFDFRKNRNRSNSKMVFLENNLYF